MSKLRERVPQCFGGSLNQRNSLKDTRGAILFANGVLAHYGIKINSERFGKKKEWRYKLGYCEPFGRAGTEDPKLPGWAEKRATSDGEAGSKE